jgi:hypothetical protein
MFSFSADIESDQNGPRTSTYHTKRRVSLTKEHGSESAKLSFDDLTNLDIIESIKRTHASNSLAAFAFASLRRVIQSCFVHGTEQDWEIEKIVDMRETKTGSQYKVVWASIWVDEEDMKNSRDLVSDFLAKRRKAKFRSDTIY